MDLRLVLLPLSLLGLGGLALYAWFAWAYRHWKRLGIPYLQPSFPFGNFRNSMLGYMSTADDLKDIYHQLKGMRYAGVFGFRRPHLMMLDPELVRHVLVKDFGTFHDRGNFVNDREPIAKHLLSMVGSPWRRLRLKLIPAFTSAKIKMMFPILEECGREMVSALEQPARCGQVVEVADLCARFATDVIALVAFGVRCNSLHEPNAEFREWGRKAMGTSVRVHVSTIMGFFCPQLAKIFRLNTGMEDVSGYIRNMVSETVRYRERNNVVRNDFMHLLLELKNKGFISDGKTQTNKTQTTGEAETENWKLSMDDVAAQAFLFFIAGFESSSATISFALYELAVNPLVHQQLVEEVRGAVHEAGGQLSYELVNKLPYLDKVVAETLRKYPPLPFLNREANQTYKIPGTDVVLDKGTAFVVNVYGMHHDPEYFPEPERFDPERFSEEEKAKRHPYVYLPFGEGPRMCLGTKFGQVQVKVGLASILLRYDVRACDQTPKPLTLHPRSFSVRGLQGLNLRFSEIAR